MKWCRKCLKDEGWILSPAYDLNPSIEKNGLSLNIDMDDNALDFGLAKSVGSSVHMLRPVLQLSFVGISSLMCGGLIGIWIIAVLFVGKAHQEAIKEDKVIC